ncbi:peptidase S8/S53 domain-containing protein [Pyronema domesticum]|nr:peptidase S8/S53 domain-containing protein [Pyronema domesticum]
MTDKTKLGLLANPTVDFIITDAAVPLPDEATTNKRKRDGRISRRYLGVMKNVFKRAPANWLSQDMTTDFWKRPGDMPGYNMGWALKSLSQTKGVDMADLPDEYSYHESAGEGSTIYVYDTGLKLDNDEIKSLEHQPDWLFVGMDPTKPAGQRNHAQFGTKADFGTGHGTCMLSLGVGKTVGVAKKAKSVVVKFPPLAGEVKLQRLSNFVMGLAEMSAHIAKNNGNIPVGGKGKVKAVINQSVGLDIDKLSQADQDNFRKWFVELYKTIMDLGAIVTTSAGNRKLPIDVTKVVPQYWSAADMPLIVAGNANEQGQLGASSQPGKQVTVNSAGSGVLCAKGYNNADPSPFNEKSGTSEASAITAGLAAYFLGLPNDPRKDSDKNPWDNLVGIDRQMMMIKVMQQLSFQRHGQNSLSQIHNGLGYKCPNPFKKLAADCKTLVKKCSIPNLRGGKVKRDDALKVPKKEIQLRIDTFCSSMKDKNMSAKKEESNYQTSSGYGVSGLRRRSPPTNYITVGASWSDDKRCANGFSWVMTEDICQEGLKAALDACDGTDTSGSTSNNGCVDWNIVVSKGAPKQTAPPPPPPQQTPPPKPAAPANCVIEDNGKGGKQFDIKWG